MASAEIALRTSKLLPAAEQSSGAHRRGEARGERRQVARRHPRKRHQWRHRLAVRPYQWLRRKDRDQEAWKMLFDAPGRARQADRSRRLVGRAAPQLPHRAQFRTSALPTTFTAESTVPFRATPISRRSSSLVGLRFASLPSRKRRWATSGASRRRQGLQKILLLGNIGLGALLLRSATMVRRW